jgi:phospholipase A1
VPILRRYQAVGSSRDQHPLATPFVSIGSSPRQRSTMTSSGARTLYVVVWLLLAAAPGTAEVPEQPDAVSESCLLRELKAADDRVRVGALRRQCAREAEAAADSLLLERLRRERAADDIRSLLTPHRRNYLIPAAYADSPNEDPFENELGEVAPEDRLDHVEAKFQLSLKFGVADRLLSRRDRLYFGFTALSFWQAFNRHVSAPFRETNYEPELFWSTPLA